MSSLIYRIIYSMGIGFWCLYLMDFTIDNGETQVFFLFALMLGYLFVTQTLKEATNE